MSESCHQTEKKLFFLPTQATRKKVNKRADCCFFLLRPTVFALQLLKVPFFFLVPRSKVCVFLHHRRNIPWLVSIGERKSIFRANPARKTSVVAKRQCSRAINKKQGQMTYFEHKNACKFLATMLSILLRSQFIARSP